MANLQYKTRGMSNPKGKPRVYFCCHAADFDAYFEDISKEVLELQNCAVWYADAAAVRDESFLADLGEMQLFVMPVTTKLLTTENAALDVEFRFAIERHIPVLPLMQEGGLDELFSQKCGDLQYLDKAKSARDLTEIPYEEKLKNYLESVLVSDEMAEKIRAAFDAYVFLSYRKKDRKYAQELMRLIHKNDFCRDIAIWYDEFLTPGENFNESIREALQKSGLFVMAVTPNLVNEENYIITTEYPMAKEEGKPILPAEVVPTDKKKLAETFAGIPACADAHDEAAFGAALLESVRDLAIRENDNSPEHNFFIGLAYLGGVDVEVDHARAVELITGAAEAGLVEAVTKLVEMYYAGIGVKCNYETAVKWQERKVELLEAAYREKPGRKCFSNLFWAAVTCGDYCEKLKWRRTAEHWYETAKKWAEETDGVALRRHVPICLTRLADLRSHKTERESYLEYCTKAYVLFKAIVAAEQTEGAYRDLAVVCGKLYRAYDREDRERTRQYLTELCETEEIIAKMTGATDDRRRYARDCGELGELYKQSGDTAAALEWCERDYLISTDIAEDEPEGTDALWDLLQSGIILGEIFHRRQGDLGKARFYYESAYAFAEKYCRGGGVIELVADQMKHVCRNMGDLCREERDFSEAKQWYRKLQEHALARLQQLEVLLEEQKASKLLRRLSLGSEEAAVAEGYGLLAEVAALEKDYAAALDYDEKGLAFCVAAAEKSGPQKVQELMDLFQKRIPGRKMRLQPIHLTPIILEDVQEKMFSEKKEDGKPE